MHEFAINRVGCVYGEWVPVFKATIYENAVAFHGVILNCTGTWGTEVNARIIIWEAFILYDCAVMWAMKMDTVFSVRWAGVVLKSTVSDILDVDSFIIIQASVLRDFASGGEGVETDTVVDVT